MDLVLTYLVALFFLGMGLVALADPERVVAYFGIATLTVDGRSEVRAVYGGFGIAVAALLVFALQSDRLGAGILAAVGLSLAGMAAGRLVSRLADGGAGFYPRLFLGLELVMAAALLWVAGRQG
jgi:hypothetical protein